MQDKQGFTLLEMMLCLAVLSVVALTSLSLIRPYSFDLENFAIDALSLQCLALSTAEDHLYNESGILIEYTEQGHVHHADTFVFDGKAIALQLGWGRLVEK